MEVLIKLPLPFSTATYDNAGHSWKQEWQ